MRTQQKTIKTFNVDTFDSNYNYFKIYIVGPFSGIWCKVVHFLVMSKQYTVEKIISRKNYTYEVMWEGYATTSEVELQDMYCPKLIMEFEVCKKLKLPKMPPYMESSVFTKYINLEW